MLELSPVDSRPRHHPADRGAPAAEQADAFEIVAGERRWRAAQHAGLHEVPVVVVEIDDKTSLEYAILENVQRADLNPIEEAQGYSRLMAEFSYTQENLAKIIGKSRSHIANMMRLVGFARDRQDAVWSTARSPPATVARCCR